MAELADVWEGNPRLTLYELFDVLRRAGLAPDSTNYEALSLCSYLTSLRPARVPLTPQGHAAAAAVVALLAGSGFLLPKLLSAPSTGPTNQAMSEIMQSADAQSITMSSSGVRLHLVSSTTMNKAGAMVQGTPEVRKGMGIQVWSVNQAGRINSAGVITPEEHKDVWMPFESATSKVFLTEEPVAGSDKPTGKILEEMQL